MQGFTSIITQQTSNIKALSYLALIQCILTLFIVFSKGYGFISVPTFFVAFTYIFHCSQFLLNAFNLVYDKPFDIFVIVGEPVSVQVLQYCITAFFFLSVGIILSKRVHSNKTNKTFDVNFCRFIGKALIVLCFIPRLFVDVALIVTYIRFGYVATYSAVTSGIVQVWAEGFYIGILLLLIGAKDNPAFCKKLFLFAVAYSIFGMISGRRQEKVCYIIVLTIIYLRYVPRKKVKLSRIIAISSLGYIFLVFIAAFGDLRSTGRSSLNDFLYAFIDNLGFKMIADQLGEFGGTGLTLAFSFISFPQYVPHNYGLTYVVSWIQVLPNISSTLNKIMSNLSFVKLIPEQYQLWLGGSYFGELYYNFGFWGSFALLPVGLLIGNISMALDEAIRSGKMTIKTAAYVLILSPLFLWIRGDFTYFIRPLAWYALLIYLLYKLFYKKKSTSQQGQKGIKEA